jgi:hypothetical protein
VPTSSARPIPLGSVNVSLWEALRISDGDMTVLTEVVARECRAGDISCPTDVDMSSRDMAQDAQMRVQPVLGSLRGLMHGLGQLPGPKHMVLLTSGWPIDERNAPTELSGIAAEASRSNVTVHSFTAEQWAMSASISRPSPRMGFDSQMLVSSVETLAGFTGGKSSRLVGSGERALQSLTDGLTGYYRLGVRPAPEDLDGRTRRISVKLSKEGASLKGYRRIMAGMRPASATPPVDPATALRNALRSPVAATGLEMRATSYVLHGAGAPGELRVVIVGDIGRAAAGPAMSMAVIYDQEGKPIVGGESTLEIVPGATATSLQTAFPIKPGNYMLRVAVRDADGAIGMVERGVDARWLKAGTAETTGLILFRHQPGRGLPRPVLDTVTTGDQLVAQLSLNAPESVKMGVVIDILKEGSDAPLLKLPARVAKASSGAVIAQHAIPMALLPPGRYTIAASVEAGGSARFTRTFAVEPEAPTETDDATAAAVTEEAPPTPPHAAPSLTAILSMTRPARFASTSVLDPSFVTPIMERLAGRPDTASVRDSLERMKIGPWPTDGAKGALAGSPLAASFVAGLARLQSGDLEGAANDFRSALRAAPDFAPAMVYLGACYAAGSKDKEAAAAWQTALLRERDTPAVAALAIDAWLRAERPAPALALLKQARVRWPSDQTFVRQHAQAALADGRTREGLEIVEGIAEPGEPLLFVALATLYHDVRAKKTVWDAARDRQNMRTLRERYAKTGGDSLALIDAWVAEVESVR